MARRQRASYTAGRGRCCTTSGRGARRRRGPTTAGTARRSGSTSTAIMTTGSRTSWCPPPWAATAAEITRPTIRDGQLFSSVQTTQLAHLPSPSLPERQYPDRVPFPQTYLLEHQDFPSCRLRLLSTRHFDKIW